MIRIDFVYGDDQPNVAFIRYQLMDAIVEAELMPFWYEWDPRDNDCPVEYREWPRPTILINGKPTQLILELLGMPAAVLSAQTISQALKAESHFAASYYLAS